MTTNLKVLPLISRLWGEILLPASRIFAPLSGRDFSNDPIRLFIFTYLQLVIRFTMTSVDSSFETLHQTVEDLNQFWSVVNSNLPNSSSSFPLLEFFAFLHYSNKNVLQFSGYLTDSTWARKGRHLDRQNVCDKSNDLVIVKHF